MKFQPQIRGLHPRCRRQHVSLALKRIFTILRYVYEKNSITSLPPGLLQESGKPIDHVQWVEDWRSSTWHRHIHHLKDNNNAHTVNEQWCMFCTTLIIAMTNNNAHGRWLGPAAMPRKKSLRIGNYRTRSDEPWKSCNRFSHVRARYSMITWGFCIKRERRWSDFEKWEYAYVRTVR
jgi:hypothetical protein